MEHRIVIKTMHPKNLPAEYYEMVTLAQTGDKPLYVPLYIRNIFQYNELHINEAAYVLMEYFLEDQEKEKAKSVGVDLLDDLQNAERVDCIMDALDLMLFGNIRECFAAVCFYLRSLKTDDETDDEIGYVYPEEKMYFCKKDGCW